MRKLLAFTFPAGFERLDGRDSLVANKASVDHNVLACDVGCGIAGKEDRGTFHVHSLLGHASQGC